MANLIDIENYCKELSLITNIDINIIRTIVLINFAQIISDKQKDFTDATEQIEKDICAVLRKQDKKISLTA